jgi:hypothetical protein
MAEKREAFGATTAAIISALIGLLADKLLGTHNRAGIPGGKAPVRRRRHVAPFDCFAIGLTRALLRRGLAPGGMGPFFYAAVDAIVAPPVILLLAFVTAFAAQSFDDIAALRAGESARILPLSALFEGLETDRPIRNFGGSGSCCSRR